MKRRTGCIILLIVLVPLVGCQSQNEAAKSGTVDAEKGSATTTGGCQAHPNSARKIAITAPCDKAKVAERDFVEGIVSDSTAKVWVIVHPMETGDFWVEPSITIKEDGSWRVLAYFGETNLHSGKPYEVVAVANPQQSLKEGQLLDSWPDAQWRSEVVDVVRK